MSCQRDQASLDSFRREYELGVKTHVDRCDAAGKARAAAAATRSVSICKAEQFPGRPYPMSVVQNQPQSYPRTLHRLLYDWLQTEGVAQHTVWRLMFVLYYFVSLKSAPQSEICEKMFSLVVPHSAQCRVNKTLPTPRDLYRATQD